MKISGQIVIDGEKKSILRSVHGSGTALEKLHAEFLKIGGIGGDGWTQKHPFHRPHDGDTFRLWLEERGITIAKSRDGAWAIPVLSNSVITRDKSGFPLAKGATCVGWLNDL